MQRSLKRNGRDHKSTATALEESAEMFTLFKLVPRVFDELLGKVRHGLEQLRRHEREIMMLSIRRGGMNKSDFIKSFPGNETDIKWLDGEIKSKKNKAIGAKLEAQKEDSQRAQKRLAQMEDTYGLSFAEIKEINRRISIGEIKARRAKKE